MQILNITNLAAAQFKQSEISKRPERKSRILRNFVRLTRKNDFARIRSTTPSALLNLNLQVHTSKANYICIFRSIKRLASMSSSISVDLLSSFFRDSSLRNWRRSRRAGRRSREGRGSVHKHLKSRNVGAERRGPYVSINTFATVYNFSKSIAEHCDGLVFKCVRIEKSIRQNSVVGT